MEKFWRQLALASNWPVLVAIGVLVSLGLVSIWADANADARSASDDVRKQAIFIGLGFGMLVLMQMVSYLRIGRFAWVFYIGSLILLIYTVMPGVPQSGLLSVPEINGARNWINFGFLNLQPAEITKIAFCMVLSRYLRFRSNYRTLLGLIPPFVLAIFPLLIILKQPDLGTALVFIPALFAMLFVAGAKLRHLGAIMGMGMILIPIAWFSGDKDVTGMDRDYPILRHMPALVRGYQRERVNALFSKDPATLRAFGFQQEQALTAFGSGGVSGRGPGSVPVGRGVPEAHNDMVLALVGEQFGFVGVSILLGAYLVLFAVGIEIAAATREPFGKLLAVGIISLLAGQTFLNIMVALRMMPVTGITLPFVSYGGSSLLASFIGAALLLNIGQNRPLVMARDAFEFD